MSGGPSTPPSVAVAAAPSRCSEATARLVRDALAKVHKLRQAEDAIVQKRFDTRSKSGNVPGASSTTFTKACSACRQAKTRCLPSTTTDSEPCPRCVAMHTPCVYPESRSRGPKRRLTKTQRLLEEIQLNLRAILDNDSAPYEEEDVTDHIVLNHSQADMVPPEGSDQVTHMLRNPLAVLAHASSDLSDNQLSGAYFEGGIHMARPESDFSFDPVLMGLLTVTDMERLVDLYFDRLHPYIWLLQPKVHTSTFLRLNSPFLSTVVAFVASTYDPLSRSFSDALGRHAHLLATRAFDGGLKSLEILQAFFILSHWSPPQPAWADDRAWTWLSEACRMGVELRMDLPPEPSMFARYRTFAPMDAAFVALLSTAHSMTWPLLFCGQLSALIQTGRIDCFRGLSLPTGIHAPAPSLPQDHPDYDYTANLHANILMARALDLAAGLREEAGDNLRNAFMASWQTELKSWRAKWPNVGTYIDVHVENHNVILFLVSLRFKGGPSDAVVLEACKNAVIRMVRQVSSWEGKRLDPLYASNFAIVNIGYSTLLLLHLSHRFQQAVDPEIGPQILKVASILEQIGRNRVNSLSVATLHAERIRSLVHTLPSIEPGTTKTTASVSSSLLDFDLAGLNYSTVAGSDSMESSMHGSMFSWLLSEPSAVQWTSEAPLGSFTEGNDLGGVFTTW